MIVLKVSSFHVDFSTLDIERGEITVIPSGINYTIKPTTILPQITLEGMLIGEEKGVDERFTKTDIETEKGVVTRKNMKSEAWLFNNPDVIASVRRGLSDAAQGKVSKVDLDTL